MSTTRSQGATVPSTIEDRSAWVKFDRPEKRNSMSPQLNRRMMGVRDTLEHDDAVGVFVLTGERSAWSAGMDLKEYFRDTEAKDLAGTRNARRASHGWWRRLRRYQKPTIPTVNAWCCGDGYGPLDVMIAGHPEARATQSLEHGDGGSVSLAFESGAEALLRVFPCFGF